jgi:pimeloyl-ACP methyl ester carboxylesterase
MNNSILYRTAEGEKAVMAIYDNALKHWPVPYEAQTVSTRHGDTFVVGSGSKTLPVLILLHGAGGNSMTWAGDVAEYSQQFRVYAVDLPGEAGKSAPNRPAWDSPAFVEWLQDVFDALQIERATLAGISQGAWTALKFATAMPERVEQLVVIAPGGIVPDKGSFILRAIGLSLLGKWGRRRFVQGLFGDQKVSNGVISTVTEMSSHFKPRLGVLPVFSDDDLRQLTMPVLLLGGTKDMMRDLGKIEARLRDFVPHQEAKMIEGGGHALMNTRGCVMEFLAHPNVEYA